jgi:hypothetical protein
MVLQRHVSNGDWEPIYVMLWPMCLEDFTKIKLAKTNNVRSRHLSVTNYINVKLTNVK